MKIREMRVLKIKQYDLLSAIVSLINDWKSFMDQNAIESLELQYQEYGNLISVERLLN